MRMDEKRESKGEAYLDDKKEKERKGRGRATDTNRTHTHTHNEAAKGAGGFHLLVRQIETSMKQSIGDYCVFTCY